MLRARRTGSSDGVFIAGTVMFLLLAFGGFMSYRLLVKREHDAALMAQTEAVRQVEEAKARELQAQRDEAQSRLEAEQAVERELSEANTPVRSAPQPLVEIDQPISDSAVTPASGTQAVSAVPNRREVVKAHLEFGEFSRALELANETKDEAERSELLRLVADAQTKIGDFDAALGSIRRIPDHNERADARAQHTSQQAMAGGSQADFTELIALIQQETNGMWEDQEGTGGTISQFQQGVHVDPTGVLALVGSSEHLGRLKELGIKARNASLGRDISEETSMRVVSLTRLEASVAKRIADGKQPVESQRLMGGLTRIDHMFVYPNDGDIVIAGPAEAWKYNQNGVPVGVESGRPVLQLDDFVDILRAFSASGNRFFSCSIDPRPEGLKALKDYVAATSSRPLSAGAGVRSWVKNLQAKLGRQNIVFEGINPQSRVARVIIEADYRMKLIGIGKYDFDGGSKIPSIFDLMTVEEQKAGKLDALRWWLTMKYDAVLNSEDRNAYEFVGSSVLCQSENQFLNSQGKQVLTGKSEGSNLVFAQTFTSKYEELARHDLVFADLKNVFDLALVAALVHHHGAAQKTGWDYGAFAIDGEYHSARFEAPREVDSVVNHRVYRGKDIVVQVAGGVRADLSKVLAQGVLKQGVRIDSASAKARTARTDAGWWWNAE